MLWQKHDKNAARGGRDEGGMREAVAVTKQVHVDLGGRFNNYKLEYAFKQRVRVMASRGRAGGEMPHHLATTSSDYGPKEILMRMHSQLQENKSRA